MTREHQDPKNPALIVRSHLASAWDEVLRLVSYAAHRDGGGRRERARAGASWQARIICTPAESLIEFPHVQLRRCRTSILTLTSSARQGKAA